MNQQYINIRVRYSFVCCTLGAIVLLMISGCMSPYMERKAALNRGDTRSVYNGAVSDMAELGQFDVKGNVCHEAVRGGLFAKHEGYFDYQLLAVNMLPQAYLDMAYVAMGTACFHEAIRHAQRSMDMANETLSEDQWLFERLCNLRDANLVLYRAYMAIGDVQQAAVVYRQHLIFSKLIDSKVGKELQTQLLCIRMSSMRLRSEYLTQKHWATLSQILMAIAAGANAAAASDAQQRGDYSAASRYQASMAANMMAIAAIEHYKTSLHSVLNMDLRKIMNEARIAGSRMRSPPKRSDILRAKRASELYRHLRIRGPVNPADQVDLRELDTMLAEGRSGALLVPQPDGTVVLRSGAARFISAAAKLDQVPLSLPPVTADKEEEWLDTYLTPGLYRLAGVDFSESERALIRQLSQAEDEVRLNPSTKNGQQMILAMRKLERKSQAYEAWRQETNEQ